MKKITLFLLLLQFVVLSFAQNRSEAEYASNPYWITMMNDEHVNYFEACKAFDLFWANREKPVAENDLFSAEEHEKENPTFIQSKFQDQNEEIKNLNFEYKKFIHWKSYVESFVKEDGTIMNASERIELWQQQLKGRK